VLKPWYSDCGLTVSMQIKKMIPVLMNMHLMLGCQQEGMRHPLREILDEIGVEFSDHF
jgi:hypothetical protein